MGQLVSKNEASDGGKLSVHYQRGVGYVAGPREGVTRQLCDLVEVNKSHPRRFPKGNANGRRERQFIAEAA